MDQPDPGKLSFLHFYAWSKGLKTRMYYLRTRVVADAIKFTVDTSFLNKVCCLNSCAGLAWFCSVFGAEWSASCRKNVLLRADVYSNVLLGFFWSWTDCCGCLLLEASFRMISVTGRTTIIYAMVLVDNLQESGLRRFVHHYAAVASGLGGWLLCSVDGGAVWPSGGKLLCYCWNLCWDMFPDLCFVGICLMESGLQLWCSVW